MSLKVATKEDILNWGKRTQYDFVSSDGTIRIRMQQMNAREMTKLAEYEKDHAISRPYQVAMSVVNEEGNRLFGDDDIDLIEKHFSMKALIEMGEWIGFNNGFGKKPEANPEDEQTKNSLATLS